MYGQMTSKVLSRWETVGGSTYTLPYLTPLTPMVISRVGGWRCYVGLWFNTEYAVELFYSNILIGFYIVYMQVG